MTGITHICGKATRQGNSNQYFNNPSLNQQAVGCQQGMNERSKLTLFPTIPSRDQKATEKKKKEITGSNKVATECG